MLRWWSSQCSCTRPTCISSINLFGIHIYRSCDKQSRVYTCMYDCICNYACIYKCMCNYWSLCFISAVTAICHVVATSHFYRDKLVIWEWKRSRKLNAGVVYMSYYPKPFLYNANSLHCPSSASSDPVSVYIDSYSPNSIRCSKTYKRNVRMP